MLILIPITNGLPCEEWFSWAVGPGWGWNALRPPSTPKGWERGQVTLMQMVCRKKTEVLPRKRYPRLVLPQQIHPFFPDCPRGWKLPWTPVPSQSSSLWYTNRNLYCWTIFLINPAVKCVWQLPANHPVTKREIPAAVRGCPLVSRALRQLIPWTSSGSSLCEKNKTTQVSITGFSTVTGENIAKAHGGKTTTVTSVTQQGVNTQTWSEC